MFRWDWRPGISGQFRSLRNPRVRPRFYEYRGKDSYDESGDRHAAGRGGSFRNVVYLWTTLTVNSHSPPLVVAASKCWICGMAPLERKLLTSSLVKPSSFSTSSVCSP